MLSITARTSELDLQMSSKFRFAQMDVSMQVGGTRTSVGDLSMLEPRELCLDLLQVFSPSRLF